MFLFWRISMKIKVGMKGSYGVFNPVWIDEINDDIVIIRDKAGNKKSIYKDLFFKNWIENKPTAIIDNVLDMVRPKQ
jgi:hypothetical protein